MSKCKIAKRDGDGNLVLDCNDTKYIRCLIDGLKSAQLNGNKQRVADYAKELTNFKQLCGTHPLLEKFEQTLSCVSNSLDLNACPHIQRALAPTPEQKNTSILKPNWNVL